ncbi:MAG: response regulator [Dissulfurimicrobium sp.]|uniref:response regulator n=1 Tax=Dissulfurimicrobium sp. TaxID=2022436 RepID=UPI00404B7379
MESQVGKGSIFNLFIPTSSGKVAEEKRAPYEATDPPLPRASGMILVMDDKETIRELMGKVLKSLGYEPYLTRDGKEAIRIYKGARDEKRPFDAVIMDLTIAGGMGDKETIQELLRIDPNAKTIVSSGYSEDPIMTHFRQ